MVMEDRFRVAMIHRRINSDDGVDGGESSCVEQVKRKAGKDSLVIFAKSFNGNKI
ncbi:hypothetical protein SAMN05421736_11855 [Evansella caseinilytica]|uniref:Uncharacterized protein n=1 Tax=Evansella caseinilytica TaxID=1503961 RepID=A0A1H3U5D4_9BACI|nr:hypothetical protein SAMN05421736_11855 [Evansella caseinilytica]